MPSGSLAVLVKATCFLVTTDENEPVGNWFATVLTVFVTVPVPPSLSVTVSFTVCGPAPGKVCAGEACVLVCPSPKSHR